MTDLLQCFPLFHPNGACLQSEYTAPCGQFDYRTRTKQPYPYLKDLPYRRTISRTDLGTVRFKPSNRTSSFQDCFGGVGVAFSSEDNAIISLYSRMASAIRGHDFNPGVSLAEMNETCGLVGSAAKRLASLANSLPRLVPHHLWLEAVYGWLPLWSDLHAGAQFFAAALSNPRRETYRVSYKLHGKLSAGFTPSGRASRKYYMIAHVKEHGNLAYTGILDPLSVAWEVTPYSFVADWFLPVGTWLQARNFLAATSISGCWGRIDNYSLTGTIESPDWEIIGNPHWKIFDFARYATLPALPLPSFRPFSQVLSNWRHAVDGLALAASAFGRIGLK